MSINVMTILIIIIIIIIKIVYYFSFFFYQLIPIFIVLKICVHVFFHRLVSYMCIIYIFFFLHFVNTIHIEYIEKEKTQKKTIYVFVYIDL